jgi:hypothetical protein
MSKIVVCIIGWLVCSSAVAQVIPLVKDSTGQVIGQWLSNAQGFGYIEELGHISWILRNDGMVIAYDFVGGRISEIINNRWYYESEDCTGPAYTLHEPAPFPKMLPAGLELTILPANAKWKRRDIRSTGTAPPPGYCTSWTGGDNAQVYPVNLVDPSDYGLIRDESTGTLHYKNEPLTIELMQVGTAGTIFCNGFDSCTQ